MICGRSMYDADVPIAVQGWRQLLLEPSSLSKKATGMQHVATDYRREGIERDEMRRPE